MLNKVLFTYLDSRDTRESIRRDLKNYYKDILINCDTRNSLLKSLYFEIFRNLLLKFLSFNMFFDSRSFDDAN